MYFLASNQRDSENWKDEITAKDWGSQAVLLWEPAAPRADIRAVLTGPLTTPSKTASLLSARPERKTRWVKEKVTQTYKRVKSIKIIMWWACNGSWSPLVQYFWKHYLRPAWKNYHSSPPNQAPCSCRLRVKYREF